MIYIIDLSDLINLGQATKYLRAVLLDSRLKNTKVLVLANKCDLLREDFLNNTDIYDYLKVADIRLDNMVRGMINKEILRWKVEKCSLTEEWGYQTGIKWIIN